MRNLLICGLLLGLVATGCRDNGHAAQPAVAQAPKTVADYFDIRVGDRVVHMQLAVSLPEMERGLMERRNLGPNEGMVFVYDSPQQMSFWMRDTPTPLDIGFFNAGGELEEIYHMLPFDERTVAARNPSLQFALEMSEGWYAANSVRPGARLDLKALAAGLTARGFDPAKFGLEP